MTTYIKNRITDVLKLNPHDFSERLMWEIILEKYEEALNNTVASIGMKEVKEDIVIAREDNNRLFNIRELKEAYYQEFKEIIITNKK